MTDQNRITFEEALKLVEGHVYGTINGCRYQYVETPREKLKRLIEEGAHKSQLLEALNQLEDN